ncbi:hypothetical protein MASR1M12_00470 [Erysipelotrichia bacterium]
MRVARAYGYTPAQVYEMDYLLFCIAQAEIVKYPAIDEAFYRTFCKSAPMTLAQKRAANTRS